MTRLLITGANRGIGLEMTRLAVERGDFVTATCRMPLEAAVLTELAKAYPEQIVIIGLDVSQERDVKSVAAGFSRPIDLLICNAGVMSARGGLTDPGHNSANISEALMTNIAGVFFTARYFLPNLLAGAADRQAGSVGRIAVISSQMGSSERSGSSAPIYRASKAAATNLARSMAVELAEKQIAVGAYHPGWVQTDMGGSQAAITPEQSAAGLLSRFDALNMETSGIMEDYQGVRLPF